MIESGSSTSEIGTCYIFYYTPLALHVPNSSFSYGQVGESARQKQGNPHHDSVVHYVM